MTQYNSAKVKLSNPQLDKLKLATKNARGKALGLFSNIIGKSNNEINFQHKLLPTNRQVSSHHQVVLNNLSANMKISGTKPSKTIQCGRFLGKLYGPSKKVGLPFIKNGPTRLVKSV